MVVVNNGYIEYKQYKIPIMEIHSFINDHDDILLEASMQDLKDMFIFGVPYNFKELLLKKVHLYDASSAVNSFKCNGKEYWLDKLQRFSIYNMLKNSKDTQETFDLILGDEIYNVSKQYVEDLLSNLESYAYKCKINTQKHLNAINSLKEPSNSKEEVEYINALVNYDYTKNYPEKVEVLWQ